MFSQEAHARLFCYHFIEYLLGHMSFDAVTFSTVSDLRGPLTILGHVKLTDSATILIEETTDRFNLSNVCRCETTADDAADVARLFYENNLCAIPCYGNRRSDPCGRCSDDNHICLRAERAAAPP